VKTTDKKYRRAYAQEMRFQLFIVNNYALLTDGAKAQVTRNNRKVWVMITEANWDKQTFTVRRILSGNRLGKRLRQAPAKALKNVKRVRTRLRGR